jgi:glutathione S-transferase
MSPVTHLVLFVSPPQTTLQVRFWSTTQRSARYRVGARLVVEALIDRLGQVKLQSWLNFLSSEMHKGGFSPLFYKGIPEEGKDVFRRRLTARFAHLDRHFTENECLMGKDFSVADVHLFVISNWASWVAFDLSPYPNVVLYRRRIAGRPLVQTAMNVEGLIPWPSTQP